MKVLFSPIGNSDPWRNLYDGPMLNIVRYYNLDKVVLYFTRTIWEGNEKRKGHKAYDWEKLSKRFPQILKSKSLLRMWKMLKIMMPIKRNFISI